MLGAGIGLVLLGAAIGFASFVVAAVNMAEAFSNPFGILMAMIDTVLMLFVGKKEKADEAEAKPSIFNLFSKHIGAMIGMAVATVVAVMGIVLIILHVIQQ